MTDGTIVRLAPTPPKVSNKEFVEEVFGQDWFRAHVCSFQPDPTTLDATGQRALWAGGPARENLPFHADWNNFYCISVFSPDPLDGRYRRRKAAHERTYVIVIDDVGLRGLDGTSAKVPADRIKLKPTFALETSPGNWQVGYVIRDGDPRGGKVAALLDALVAAGLNQDGKDPGMKGVTRYVRLPVGRNTKAKYGTAGFDHVLGSWNPSRKYTLEEIADAYGVRAELDAAEDDLGAGGAGKVDPGSDFIAKVLDEAGLIHSWDAQKSLWHVTCPFVGDHTARADSGTAYLGGGRWTCHHGHCVDRDFSDFSEKLRQDFPAEWKRVVRSEFDDGLGGGGDGDGGGPEGIAPSAMERELGEVFGEEAVSEHKEKKELGPFQSRMSAAFGWEGLNGFDPLAVGDWLLKGLVPGEGLGIMYGAPGIGKSFVALDLMLRLAAGKGWHGLRNKAVAATAGSGSGDRGGDVWLYVSSEGGGAEIKRRMLAWSRRNGVRPEKVVMWPGSFAWGVPEQGGVDRPEDLVRWCRTEFRGCRVRMVVVDTIARNMAGDENATRDMSAFVAAMDVVRRGLGCFVMGIHHEGKDESKGARGSTALRGAVDLEIRLAREAGVSDGLVVVEKNRIGEDGQRWGFRLADEDLGVDADGDQVTTKVVEACKPPSGAGKGTGTAKTTSATEKAIVEAYETLCDENGWADLETIGEWVQAAVKSGRTPGLNKAKNPGHYVSECMKRLVDPGHWVLMEHENGRQFVKPVGGGSGLA